MGRVISIEFVNERRTAVDGKTKFLHQMQRLPGKNPGSAIMFSHQTSGFDEAAPRRTACPLNAIETTSQRERRRKREETTLFFGRERISSRRRLGSLFAGNGYGTEDEEGEIEIGGSREERRRREWRHVDLGYRGILGSPSWQGSSVGK